MSLLAALKSTIDESQITVIVAFSGSSFPENTAPSFTPEALCLRLWAEQSRPGRLP